ncbi:cell division/GTP binding protein [Hesseltinella vesiculosa]|uniref:Cell division/GTP binding protein n=1 Tax=Hesseltinella vesiculosa TaxID=101127 RepID=A0A1X2GG82_9FUNG|nr:cell division/GTP binding protein [Hesseltinella vesiculosa]
MAPRSRKPIVNHFNVMVVGFAGVGKTSFVRTLLESLKMTMPQDKRDTMFQPSSNGNGQTLIEGPLERTLVPYTVSIDAEVDGDKMVLTLIDTPGFQSSYLIDKQLNDIIGYIEHQFDLTLAEESKVKRNTKAVDTQVHACLYFVDPSKRDLDEQDIRVLNKLSRRANVIPVIGKADTLTLAQRNRLRPTIIKSIYNSHRIPVYGMPEDDDDEDEAEEAATEATDGTDEKTPDAVDTKPKERATLDDFLEQFHSEDEDDEVLAFVDYLRSIPFSVIACEEDPETGSPLKIQDGDKTIHLGRDYGWGKIDCLSDDVSDFNRLKTMLLVSHRRILISDTLERFYEQYRTERLLQRRATKYKSVVASKQILQDLSTI